MLEIVDSEQMLELLGQLSPFVFGGVILALVAWLLGYVIGGLLALLRSE